MFSTNEGTSRWCRLRDGEGHYVSERQLAYTISDRDFILSPKAILPVGTKVRYTQCIQRVGYERDVYSIPKEILNDTAASILANKLDIDVQIVKKVVDALGLSYPYKRLKGEVYQKHFRHDKKVKRHMWFWKPENKEHFGIVQRKIVRYTGTYWPAERASYEDYAYDPPWLEGYRQHLYLVTDECCDRLRLVYPDDVTILEKGV